MGRPSLFIINLNIIILLTFNTAIAGNAEESSVLHIGLDDAIERAVVTNEEVKIKETEVDKARDVYRETRVGLLPHVNAQSTWTRNTAYPDTAEKNDYALSSGISASQVIWSFGKIYNAVNSAKKAAEANAFSSEATRQNIVYYAKLSYYSALLAENSLSITEKSYTNTLENKKLLSQRSYGGRSPKYEIIKMDADVAARIPSVNEARTQRDTAFETLKKVIGADSRCTVDLTTGFAEQYDDYAYEDLVKAMYASEPSLKSLSKSAEAAEAAVKSKQASFFPTVSVFANWDRIGGSNDDSSLDRNDLDRYTAAGVKVTVPLWEGGEKQAQLGQSRAERKIALLRKQQAERELLLQLRKAYLEYQQYKDNLKANIEAVRLAEESFKQMQEMFATGQVTLTDLNAAELLLTNQRLNKEMTLFNINITLARIAKLIAEQYDENTKTQGS